MSEIATPSLVQISLPMISLPWSMGFCLGMIQSITILSNRPEFQHRKSFRLQLSVSVFPFRDEKAGNLWDWQSEWLSLTLNGYVLRPITFNVASSWSIYHHFIYPSFVDFQLALMGGLSSFWKKGKWRSFNFVFLKDFWPHVIKN